MTDEEKQRDPDVPFADEEPAREETPFDEDPPIDPSVPQVGNSKARFFVPAREEPEESGDERSRGGSAT